ncbi:MAG: phosphoribosylanthranilate isomerase [Gammaproteobacteria bacterium]
MLVKICGLTTPEGVAAAVKAGADAVGFVFSASPRQVSPRQARKLAAGLPPGTRRVAVFRHPPPGWIEQVLQEFPADWVQSDAVDLPGVDLGGADPLPVFRSGAPLPALLPERLLFEGPESGAGRVADWAAAAELARRTRVVLAGGLHPGNVAEALERVQPWGVDVSSGVESAPGIKAPALVAAFVAAARRGDES